MMKDAALNVGDAQVLTQVVLVRRWFEELTRLVPTDQ